MSIRDPKPGDKIRVVWELYRGVEVEEYTLEMFRYCLGFFKDKNDRKAGRFVALSDYELYCDGPDSEHKYISNYGDYVTNQVPNFEIISK